MIPTKEARIFHIPDLNWVELHADPCPIPLYAKKLVEDDRTGMIVNVSKYPKGYNTAWHTHTCSHGMLVLEGRLRTHLGVVEKGDFVWFPEGTKMEHGATAEEDCTVLFITNAPFDIRYLTDGEIPG